MGEEKAMSSGLENYFAVVVLGHLGAHLPPVTREFRFAPPRLFRFDFAFVQERVAVELDGGAWSGGRHVTGKGFQRDCEKLNLATLRGWRVLRYTSDMIEGDPAACLRQIEALLKGAGR